jgi:hypothetical protein
MTVFVIMLSDIEGNHRKRHATPLTVHLAGRNQTACGLRGDRQILLRLPNLGVGGQLCAVCKELRERKQ